MKKSKNINRYKLSGYIHFTLFVLATIILGIIRYKTYITWLADVNKTERDSIWQLVYPIFYMPIVSLIYGISEGGKKYRYIIPFIACLAGFFQYVCVSDGGKFIGETIPLTDIVPTGIPSFIAALAGIGIIRIILVIIKSIKNYTNKK